LGSYVKPSVGYVCRSASSSDDYRWCWYQRPAHAVASQARKEATVASVKDDDDESLDYADEGEYAYTMCTVCEGEGCEDCNGTGEEQPLGPRYRNPTYGWHTDDRA
jgi:hypothetical protein